MPYNKELKELHVDTFSLPEYLGHVKDSWSSGTISADSRRAPLRVPYNDRLVNNPSKIVIHIQDAHCNYYAQHKISEIIEYLSKEYGVDTINLEGGAKDYDLSIFTKIEDKSIRNKTSDYFVKEGLVNGAEYFAINNPDKATLWGVEDTKLYIDNLNVYRESLKHKEEVGKDLEYLTHILNNLKTKIYSPELLELDTKYTQYKAGTLEFKDYLSYLIQTKNTVIARAEGPKQSLPRSEIASSLTSFAPRNDELAAAFPNIHLLSQALDKEGSIDFKRANGQRDNLIDSLQKKLSKKSLEELVLKTVEFKSEKISQKDFYAYLVSRAQLVNIGFKEFPELQKYIAYISMYSTIDKMAVMGEVDALENKIKETLYRNDNERQLNKRAKNLAILKNIFNISLTKEDYRYYTDNKDSFNISSFTAIIPSLSSPSFLRKQESNIDRYREDISKFYEYSFKRDKAFLRNLKFQGSGKMGQSPPRGNPNLGDSPYFSSMSFLRNLSLQALSREQESTQRIAILITGGFHTANLAELFREQDISYISIMPNFKNDPSYECPYFKILSGEKSLQIREALPTVLNRALAIPGQLCPEIVEAMSGIASPAISEEFPASVSDTAPANTAFFKKYSADIFIFSTIAGTLIMSATFATFIDWPGSNIFVASANALFIAMLNFNIVVGIAAKVLSFTKPLILPGIDIKDGIPPEFKTVAYYPILFKAQEELKFFDENLIPSIENNNDPNIRWVILSTSGGGIHELERERISQLQKDYGGDRIFYIHRDDSMNNWERKRGGYMHFMLWLKNSLRVDGALDKDTRFPACPAGKVFDEILGDISALKNTKNFVVGDSDTIWTKDSIRGIVSKIEHPANKEYGIFQGRVEPHNTEESILTKYSYHVYKKFIDDGNRLWRVLRKVKFMGHGAGWNIDRFLSDMAGKIKDGYLSHDTIEGIFSNTALLEDIVTSEELPPNLFLQVKQWFRWWLGDKTSFIFFKKEVPDESGKLIKNPATIVDKYWLYVSTKNYLSAPILLGMILINMIFSQYIFYRSLTLLGVVYSVLISYELYGSALVGDKSVADLYKSVRSMIMSVLLAPVIVAEISIFVVRSYMDDIKSAILKTENKLEWAPQGGLSRDLTLKQSFSNLKYVMLFAVIIMSIYHNYLGVGLYYFFGALVISPITAWYTSRAPPSTKTARATPAENALFNDPSAVTKLMDLPADKADRIESAVSQVAKGIETLSRIPSPPWENELTIVNASLDIFAALGGFAQRVEWESYANTLIFAIDKGLIAKDDGKSMLFLVLKDLALRGECVMYTNILISAIDKGIVTTGEDIGPYLKDLARRGDWCLRAKLLISAIDNGLITTGKGIYSSLEDLANRDEWNWYAKLIISVIGKGLMSEGKGKPLLSTALENLARRGKWDLYADRLISAIDTGIMTKNDGKPLLSTALENLAQPGRRHSYADLLVSAVDKGIMTARDDIEPYFTDLNHPGKRHSYADLLVSAIYKGIVTKHDGKPLLSTALENLAKENEWHYYAKSLLSAIDKDITDEREGKPMLSTALENLAQQNKWHSYAQVLISAIDKGIVANKEDIDSYLARLAQPGRQLFYETVRNKFGEWALSDEPGQAYIRKVSAIAGEGGVALSYRYKMRQLAIILKIPDSEALILMDNGKDLLDWIKAINASIESDDKKINYAAFSYYLEAGLANLLAISPRLATQVVAQHLQRGYMPLLLDTLTVYSSLSPAYVQSLREYIRGRGRKYLNKPEFFLKLAGFANTFNSLNMNIEDFCMAQEGESIKAVEKDLGQRLIVHLAKILEIEIDMSRADTDRIISEWKIGYLGLLVSIRQQWPKKHRKLFTTLLKFTLEGKFDRLISSDQLVGIDLSSYTDEEREAIASIQAHNKNMRVAVTNAGIDFDRWLTASSTNKPEPLYTAGETAQIRTPYDILIDFKKYYNNFSEWFDGWQSRVGYLNDWNTAKKRMGPWENIPISEDASIKRRTKTLSNKSSLQKLTGLLDNIQLSMPGNVPEAVADLIKIVVEIRGYGADADLQGPETNYRIRFWDRWPGKDAFLGNQASSYTSLGTNASAIFEFLLDAGTHYVVIEEVGGEPKGYIRIFLARDIHNKPAIFIDSIDGRAALKYRKAMISYIKDFAETIGISKDRVLDVDENENIGFKIGDALTDTYFHHSGIDIPQSVSSAPLHPDVLQAPGPTPGVSSNGPSPVDPPTASSLIGKLRDRNGNVVTSFNVTQHPDGETMQIQHDGETLATVPVDSPLGREFGEFLLRELKRFIESNIVNLPDHIRTIAADLNNKIDSVDEIVVLRHHKDVMGAVVLKNNNKYTLYLNNSILKNPLALIHELGEGVVTLPEGYENLTRHTIMRGVGKDVRNAFDAVEKDEWIPAFAGMTVDEEAEAFIKMLEKKMKELDFIMSGNRTRDGPIRSITDSEKALIRWNYANGVRGQDALFGVQDFISAKDNAALSTAIRDLSVKQVFVKPTTIQPKAGVFPHDTSPIAELLQARIRSLEVIKQNIENGLLPDIISFGDKHGRSEDLEAILNKARMAEAEHKTLTIIGHGDVFDGGINNWRNFEILKELKQIAARNHNIKVELCLGNHEVMMIWAVLLGGGREACEKWMENGGNSLLVEFQKRDAIALIKDNRIIEMASWVLTNFKLYHVDEVNYLHLHAGIPVNADGSPTLTMNNLRSIQSEFEELQREAMRAHIDRNRLKRLFFGHARPLYETREDKWISSFAEIAREDQIVIDDDNRDRLFGKIREMLRADASTRGRRAKHQLDSIIESCWVEILLKHERKFRGQGINFKVIRREPSVDVNRLDEFLTTLGVNGVIFGHIHLERLLRLDNRVFCVDVEEGDLGHLTLGSDGIRFKAVEREKEDVIATKEDLLANIDAEIFRLKQALGKVADHGRDVPTGPSPHLSQPKSSQDNATAPYLALPGNNIIDEVVVTTLINRFIAAANDYAETSDAPKLSDASLALLVHQDVKAEIRIMLRNNPLLDSRMVSAVETVVKVIKSDALSRNIVQVLGLCSSDAAARTLWELYEHADSYHSDEYKDVYRSLVAHSLIEVGSASVSYVINRPMTDKGMIEILGDIGDPSAVPALADAYKTAKYGDYILRLKIREAVEKIGGVALPYLLGRLEDEKEDNRYVCQLLVGIKPSYVIPRMTGLAKRDISLQNRLNILDALGTMESKGLHLTSAARREPSLRRELVDLALSSLTDKLGSGAPYLSVEMILKASIDSQDVPGLIDLYGHSGIEARSVISEVLAKEGGDTAVSFLVNEIVAPGKPVATAALRALAQMAKAGRLGEYFKNPRDNQKSLVRILESEVRKAGSGASHSASILSAIGTERAIDIVIGELERKLKQYGSVDAALLEALMMTGDNTRGILIAKHANLVKAIDTLSTRLLLGPYSYTGGADGYKNQLAKTFNRWLIFIGERRNVNPVMPRQEPLETYLHQREKIADLIIRIREYIAEDPDRTYDGIMACMAEGLRDLGLRARVRFRMGAINYVRDRERVRKIEAEAARAGIMDGAVINKSKTQADPVRARFVTGLIGFIPENVRIRFLADTIHVALDPESYGRVRYRQQREVGHVSDGYDRLTPIERTKYQDSGGVFSPQQDGAVSGVALSGLLTFECSHTIDQSDNGVILHEVQHRFFHGYASDELKDALSADKDVAERLAAEINWLTARDRAKALEKLIDVETAAIMYSYQNELISKIIDGGWVRGSDIANWFSFYKNDYMDDVKETLNGIEDSDVRKSVADKIFSRAEEILRKHKPLIDEIINLKARIIEKDNGLGHREARERANEWVATFLQTVPITKFGRLHWLVSKLTAQVRKQATIKALNSEEDRASRDPITVAGVPWWVIEASGREADAYFASLESEISSLLEKKEYGPANGHKIKFFAIEKDLDKTKNNIQNVLNGKVVVERNPSQEVVIFVPQVEGDLDEAYLKSFGEQYIVIPDAYSDIDISRAKGFPDVYARIAITRLIAWIKESELLKNAAAKDAGLEALTTYLEVITGNRISANSLASLLGQIGLLKIGPVDYRSITDWRNNFEAVATAL